jgi:hypothetical protein
MAAAPTGPLSITQWSKIVEISPQFGLYKIQQTIRLGKINGRTLELEIDPARDVPD